MKLFTKTESGGSSHVALPIHLNALGIRKLLFEVVRWSMLASTLALAIFGYSDQLRLIISHQSVGGLSFWMILLSFWSWTSYTLYGFFQKDYKMFWPNLIGVFFVALILLGFLLY